MHLSWKFFADYLVLGKISNYPLVSLDQQFENEILRKANSSLNLVNVSLKEN